MLTITPAAEKKSADADEFDESLEPEVPPLTAEEANQWRKRNPAVSPWWVVRVQILVGGAVALAAGLWFANVHMAWSAGYGALAVVIPAALFARGLSRQRLATHPSAAITGFMVWEMVKITLTVAMLVAAPRLVSQLSWLALLAGFVVTMKVYWVAMWLRPVRRNSLKD